MTKRKKVHWCKIVKNVHGNKIRNVDSFNHQRRFGWFATDFSQSVCVVCLCVFVCVRCVRCAPPQTPLAPLPGQPVKPSPAQSNSAVCDMSSGAAGSHDGFLLLLRQPSCSQGWVGLHPANQLPPTGGGGGPSPDEQPGYDEVAMKDESPGPGLPSAPPAGHGSPSAAPSEAANAVCHAAVRADEN